MSTIKNGAVIITPILTKFITGRIEIAIGQYIEKIIFLKTQNGIATSNKQNITFKNLLISDILLNKISLLIKSAFLKIKEDFAKNPTNFGNNNLVV